MRISLDDDRRIDHDRPRRKLALYGDDEDGAVEVIAGHTESERHRTAWIEAGPADGPLMFFLHGWPELGLVWRAQIEEFAARGWRCVAPDMRGYGGSSVPTATAAYAVRELVADMLELHNAIGGGPALWVGHDWGSAVAWAMASHHPDRCRGVVNLCVPYFSRGLALTNVVPLIDRALYPVERYPVGQWDYWLFYREHFAQAASDFEADPNATFSFLYRTANRDAAVKPARSAGIRAQGGWFGSARRAPAIARDEALIAQADFDALVDTFAATGFSGANAWYLNDTANIAFADEAPDFGRLSLPVLFVHAARDAILNTVSSGLAEPMRDDCADLTEVTIDGGHELMLERPLDVNRAIGDWLSSKRIG